MSVTERHGDKQEEEKSTCHGLWPPGLPTKVNQSAASHKLSQLLENTQRDRLEFRTEVQTNLRETEPPVYNVRHFQLHIFIPRLHLESWHDPGLWIIHIYLGAPSVYAVSQTSWAPILSRPPCLQDSFPLTYRSQTEDLNSRWWSSCATSLRWPQFSYHRRRNMYETECLWQADACVLGSRERLVYWYKPSTGHWKRRPYKRIQSGVYTVPEPHNVALVIDILGNCFPSDIANTSSICC